jgi:hypothetical protein
LQTGLKFEVPFVVLVVLPRTSSQPVSWTKPSASHPLQSIRESPTARDFTRIFHNYCDQVGVPFEHHVVERLMQEVLYPRKIQLRGCQPRDLIGQALALAEYRGQPRRLTPALLEAACDSYFVDDREVPIVHA